MEVNEADLKQYPCPLMDTGTSAQSDIAFSLAKTAILRSFEGNPLTISKLRDRYVTLWDSYWRKEHNEEPGQNATGAYWAGPRTSIVVANKIISFLNEYEVVAPIQPYNYVLDTLVVSGVSCVVRKKLLSIKQRSYFTVILQEEVKEDQANPDVSALAKWYQVESLYGSVVPSGILYVPLLKGKPRQLFIQNVKLAKQWIHNGFLEERTKFPIAGSYCSDCKTKKCREVLDVGQNEDHRAKWLRAISSRR